ncbi:MULTISPECIES: hypothetical protein [Cysteiniphilum]|uniref:hypothetical protein n=1 Tax=Cysteiniphilum TaxID=2056696 RepID=UPI00177A7BD0|nr:MULTISPECIES: hypothetical protein [Cysteiniphilum]
MDMQNGYNTQTSTLQAHVYHDAMAMLKMGVPISVVAKTLQIPSEQIRHLKNERSNNNE